MRGPEIQGAERIDISIDNVNVNINYSLVPEPTRDQEDYGIVFRMGDTEEDETIMASASVERTIDLGGKPLSVRVRPTKGGKPVGTKIAVVEVQTNPPNIVTSEFDEGSDVVRFSAPEGVEPGDVTATVFVEFSDRTGAKKEIEGDLTLIVEAAEPDGLAFEDQPESGGGDQPPPPPPNPDQPPPPDVTPAPAPPAPSPDQPAPTPPPDVPPPDVTPAPAPPPPPPPPPDQPPPPPPPPPPPVMGGRRSGRR